MLFERNQVVLAKGEGATPGTDASPTGTDAIKCGLVDVTVDGKQLNDLAVRSSISAEPRRFVNKTVRISIPVAVKGSGAAGTAPEIDPLLQACALKATTSAGVSVAYTPLNTAADMKTCTIYVYKDGLVIKAVGCMGELTFNGQAGEFATFTFDMQGKFASASDASNPTPTYDDVDPIEVKTYGFSFGSYNDAVARNFGFTSGNNLVSRPNINAADGLEPFMVTARDPQWSSTIEAVLEVTNTFWGDFIDRDTVALDFAHGTVAGNTVEFAAPAANYDAPRMAGEDSIQMYNLSGQLLESSGKDNFTITFK
jgi:hypothetical protein